MDQHTFKYALSSQYIAAAASKLQRIMDQYTFKCALSSQYVAAAASKLQRIA